MRILITGASGFIGSHLFYDRLASGDNVLGIDVVKPYRARIPGVIPNIQMVDICNYVKLKKVFKEFKPEVVIHLAALAGVGGSIKNPDLYRMTNQMGFFNVISLSHIYEVKQFIYASSSSIYGENNSKECKSVYAETKASNEEVSRRYSSSKMQVTGLRFFTVYGPYGRPEMSIYKWTEQSLKGEDMVVYDFLAQCRRYYTYIDDVIFAIDKLIKHKEDFEDFSIFDVAGPEPIDIYHAARLIQIKTKTESRIVLKENLDYDVSFCYPENLFPNIPNTRFLDGLSKFIEWAKNGGIPC